MDGIAGFHVAAGRTDHQADGIVALFAHGDQLGAGFARDLLVDLAKQQDRARIEQDFHDSAVFFVLFGLRVVLFVLVVVIVGDITRIEIDHDGVRDWV